MLNRWKTKLLMATSFILLWTGAISLIIIAVSSDNTLPGWLAIIMGIVQVEAGALLLPIAFKSKQAGTHTGGQ